MSAKYGIIVFICRVLWRFLSGLYQLNMISTLLKAQIFIQFLFSSQKRLCDKTPAHSKSILLSMISKISILNFLVMACTWQNIRKTNYILLPVISFVIVCVRVCVCVCVCMCQYTQTLAVVCHSSCKRSDPLNQWCNIHESCIHFMS
jgi:hypothetical protein